MSKFIFFHGYSPETWDAMIRHGLVGDNDGIRFCQSIRIDESLKFNELAKVGGTLYHIIKEKKRPLLIDRMQGGDFIQDYVYDADLIEEYRNMLGDGFFGFQFHEWLSNYYSDANRKPPKDLSPEEWTADNISRVIFDKYKTKYLYLESMTLDEFVAAGKPVTVEQFYRNMTDIFKKRQQIGPLVPCDSEFLAYGFEVEQGVKHLLPEVGAQSANARLQICYARGMSRREGMDFGIYSEPWGGAPLTVFAYFGAKNEWGIGSEPDTPYKPAGPNGGSSRSLQKRVSLYGYLSGAAFMSEEWGLYNTFREGTDYELSEYGLVKKEFLDFTRRYTDIGDKLTPIAAVLPAELPVLNHCYVSDNFCGYPVKSERLNAAKRGVCEIFATGVDMIGNEVITLKNTDMPDAVDLLNREDAMLSKYDYLVDLTGDADFADKFTNRCTPEQIPALVKELFPCYVEGGLHWMVNEREGGGYYLSVFNHSGVERTLAEGEKILHEADKTVAVSFKGDVEPNVLEGLGTLSRDGDGYTLTVPAGDWAFIRF